MFELLPPLMGGPFVVLGSSLLPGMEDCHGLLGCELADGRYLALIYPIKLNVLPEILSL